MANPLGAITGGVVGAGVGIAAADVAAPVLELEKQRALQDNPYRVLDLGALAELVAQGIVDLKSAEAEALRNGYNANKLIARVQLALKAPDVEVALELWRKGKISKQLAEHALDKAGIEAQYHEPLLELYSERLSPEQVALGIVRSVMKDPGLLPVSLDTSGGTVPAYVVSPIDPLTEAQAGGVDRERLRIMVGEIGLPMSVQQAASALFRGIIEHGDYNRAVLEGDTRPEWADAILEQARQIASASDYVNARIRGWISDAEMYAGTARHGMSQADTHLLYLIHGRPAAPGQMATAAVRGINGPDGRPMDETQFLKGIAESDIRPEWGPMLWESRFLYLPAFQLSRLVTSGAISPETGREWAIKERYAPEVCDALYKAWTAPSSGAAKTLTVADWQALAESGHKTHAEAVAGIEGLGYTPTDAQAKLDTIQARRVDSELSKAMTDLRKAYLKDNLPPDITRIALADLGTAPWAVDEIMRIWDAQKNFSFSAP